MISRSKTYNGGPISLQKYFPSPKKVTLREKKEFVIAVLDLDHKTIVIHIAVLNISF